MPFGRQVYIKSQWMCIVKRSLVAELYTPFGANPDRPFEYVNPIGNLVFDPAGRLVGAPAAIVVASNVVAQAAIPGRVRMFSKPRRRVG